MKEFYFSFVAIIMVAACTASTIRTACTYVPECPSENNNAYTVHVPYKDDCHKYYICNSKCGYLMECPLMKDTGERLVFNPKLQVCDWPTGNEMCSNTTESMTSSIIPGKIVDCNLVEACQKAMIKTMVHDTDCHKFYMCIDGNKYLTSCEENKIYNPKTKNCDDPATTTCYITGTNCHS